MRRALGAAGLSAALALIFATAFHPTASATDTPSILGSPGGVADSRVHPNSLFCEIHSQGDSGYAVDSQNYESHYDSYDAVGADDVSFKNTHCKVRRIDLFGRYYNGSGPAASENVTFYQDAGGYPGQAFNSQTAVGSDDAGNFVIYLSQVNLRSHHTYWVSVQVNMNFSPGGQWGWENTYIQKGSPAQWQNPGDGWGTGCTTWQSVQTCRGAPGPDLMFALSAQSH
jgi:hypothetical protein